MAVDGGAEGGYEQLQQLRLEGVNLLDGAVVEEGEVEGAAVGRPLVRVHRLLVVDGHGLQVVRVDGRRRPEPGRRLTLAGLETAFHLDHVACRIIEQAFFLLMGLSV